DEQRVVGVQDDDVLFGREVVEEGARRDLGRLRDLLDGGRLVALLLEEAHGLALDGLPGPLLLALPQPARGKAFQSAARSGTMEASARSAAAGAREGRNRPMRRAPASIRPVHTSSTSAIPSA